MEDVWARLGKICACVDALGVHRRYKLLVCVDCSVFLSCKCMTRVWFAGLILFIGDPDRIKLSVSPASEMSWLTSTFILGVLNSFSWFGDYLLFMEQSFDSGSIRDVTLLVQFLWTIFLSPSYLSAS